jgi:transcription antitermination factor NusG
MTHAFHWFALLTRSNFEQVVFDQIVQKKMEVFLPKTKKISRRRDRKQIIDVPLFPGYLFVKASIDPACQLFILKTQGVVRFLGNHQGPIPVPDTQIHSLKILTAADTDLITGPCSRLAQGDPVMVMAGPFAGARGEFIQYKGKGRVIVKLPLLGRYAGVEIDEAQVEKIPDSLS